MYQIENGQKVILFFRSGISFEGIVENWSDKTSIIRSISSSNLLIIQNTKDDIVAIKLILEEPVQTAPQPVQAELQPVQELKLQSYEPDPKLRAMKLAELKRELINEEKRRVQEELSTFRASDTAGNVVYDNIIRKL